MKTNCYSQDNHTLVVIFRNNMMTILAILIPIEYRFFVSIVLVLELHLSKKFPKLFTYDEGYLELSEVRQSSLSVVH
jgi:hypothetical protein